MVLGNELTTLWEADGAIKKREERICAIMGPLDMRGLVGAATIMDCLKHGAWFSGLDVQDDSVLILGLKEGISKA